MILNKERTHHQMKNQNKICKKKNHKRRINIHNKHTLNKKIYKTHKKMEMVNQ